MNINYSDENIMVNYLQYFIRDNYSKTTKMSWVYDEYTHGKLLEFLDMPNSTESNELSRKINKIQYIPINGSYDGVISELEYPFNAMQCHTEKDKIVYFLKNPYKIIGFVPSNPIDPNLDPRILKFKSLIPILLTVYDDVEKLVSDNGWKISIYPSMYKDVNTQSIEDIKINDIDSITVTFEVDTKTNMFPHFDMRYMVNYFNNDFVNNYMISDDYFVKSSSYRVGLVKCKPGDTFIISHGYSYSIPIKVGYCSDKMSDVIEKFYTSTNNTSIKIKGTTENSVDKLIPSIPMLVKVPEHIGAKVGDDNYYQTILLLIPNLKYTKQSDIKSQTPLSFVDTNMRVGDISNDGEVDEIDRLIYACQRPKDMGEDEIYYFTVEYDRYSKLCECIEHKYENMFHTNASDNHQYNNKTISYNIDKVVEHLKVLCSGSDISFIRYLVNGVISYKIKIGDNQSSKNMRALNDYSSNGFSVNDFDAYLTAETEEEKQSSYLNKYIYDSDNDKGYDLSSYKTTTGTRVICGSGMTTNNLLVIKTNPYDEIVDCSKILNGSHNNADGTLTLPIGDFKSNPWMVRDEFMLAVLDMLTSRYSREEDIKYVHDLIKYLNNDERVDLGGQSYLYTDELKSYIKNIQINLNSPFSFGYFDLTAYTEIYNEAHTNRTNRQKYGDA